MTAPSVAGVTQAIVDRLKTALHREQGGPFAQVKVYAGELQRIIEDEPLEGLDAIWVHPLSSEERALTDLRCQVELRIALYVAISNLYGDEGRLLGKGGQAGALPEIDDIRDLMFNQKLEFDDLVPLRPAGFQAILESRADDAPVVVYQYDWVTSFQSTYQEDDDGTAVIDAIRSKYHAPPASETPIIEGETTLEED